MHSRCCAITAFMHVTTSGLLSVSNSLPLKDTRLLHDSPHPQASISPRDACLFWISSLNFKASPSHPTNCCGCLVSVSRARFRKQENVCIVVYKAKNDPGTRILTMIMLSFKDTPTLTICTQIKNTPQLPPPPHTPVRFFGGGSLVLPVENGLEIKVGLNHREDLSVPARGLSHR